MQTTLKQNSSSCSLKKGYSITEAEWEHFMQRIKIDFFTRPYFRGIKCNYSTAHCEKRERKNVTLYGWRS
jgi:hypothetical protein